MASKASKPIELKLFTDRRTGKLLYAEASKDFVDFLLSFLILPVGYVVESEQKDSKGGSIGNLYESIKNLSSNCIQTGKKKDMLLKPRPLFIPFGLHSPRFLQDDAKGDPMKFYTCSNNHRCFTGFHGAPCGQCKGAMTTECIYVANDGTSSSSVGGGGFVKDAVVYAVTDDLVVKPFQTEVLDDIIVKFGLKDSAKRDMKVVEVAAAEELAILKAALKSKTVLTDTFLRGGKKKG